MAASYGAVANTGEGKFVYCFDIPLHFCRFDDSSDEMCVSGLEKRGLGERKTVIRSRARSKGLTRAISCSSLFLSVAGRETRIERGTGGWISIWRRYWCRCAPPGVRPEPLALPNSITGPSRREMSLGEPDPVHAPPAQREKGDGRHWRIGLSEQLGRNYYLHRTGANSRADPQSGRCLNINSFDAAVK